MKPGGSPPRPLVLHLMTAPKYPFASIAHLSIRRLKLNKPVIGNGVESVTAFATINVDQPRLRCEFVGVKCLGLTWHIVMLIKSIKFAILHHDA